MGLFGGGGFSLPSLPSIGGGGNPLSSLADFIPGIGDAKAQEKANKINVQEAHLNREFQERMANTAYQRGMEDMKKAGLNPMLAYQQGGAAVPTGAQGTAAPASKTALLNTALQAYTGISAARSQAMQAQTAQSQAQSSIALQGAQTTAQIAATEKTQAETAKTIDSIKNQKKQRELLQSQMRLEKTKSAAAELANKGVDTLNTMSDKFLKNSAKPSVNPKTLEYEHPFKKPFKNFFGSDNGPLIKKPH